MNNQASSPSPDEKDYELKAAKWRNEKETLEKRYDTTFKVFGCLFILSGLAICLYNVPTFRSYAASKAVFIFPLNSLWWCLFGFAFHFVLSSSLRQVAGSSPPSQTSTFARDCTQKYNTTMRRSRRTS